MRGFPTAAFKTGGFNENWKKGEIFFQHGIHVGNKFWMLQAYRDGKFFEKKRLYKGCYSPMLGATPKNISMIGKHP